MAANIPNAQPLEDRVSQLEQMIEGNKGKASEAQRREFTDTWVALTKREGLKTNAVETLFKGFSIAEAEPLYCYVLETGDRDAYKRLFISSQAREDSVAAMKIALSLFAYELIMPTSDDSVDLVARRLGGLILTKNGKPQSALKSSVGTLLVKPLSKASISELARIESPRASNLANYLRPGLDAVVSRRGAKTDDLRAANELIDWLGKQKVVIADERPEKPASVVTERKTTTLNPSEGNAPNSQPEKPAQSPASPEPAPTVVTADSKPSARTASGSSRSDKPEEPTKSGNPPKPARKSSKKPTKDKEGNEGGDLDMATVIAFLSKLQKDHDELEGQLGSVRSEKIEMSGKIIELEQRLRAAQREIDSLKDHRSTLSGNYSALQQQCEALKAENQSLHSELDDANEMIAMMDEGSSHEADAALASLGRELGYDYRKYLAAADQPMTAELGSIVLGQLRTVFGILERHGIDLQ